MLQQKTTRMMILAFLLIGLIVTTTGAFSYWRQITVSNDVEIVQIGEPVELVVKDLNLDIDSKRLVPNGYTMFVGDVDEVTLTYQVGVSRELLNEVHLIVQVTNLTIGEEFTYSHLVNVEILGHQDEAVLDLFNDVLTLEIKVRLDEPIDEAEAIEKGLDLSQVNVDNSKLAYESIKGKEISFELRFELRNKTI